MPAHLEIQHPIALTPKNHVFTITPLMGPLNTNGDNSSAINLPPEERLRRGEEVLLKKFPAPSKAPRIIGTFQYPGIAKAQYLYIVRPHWTLNFRYGVY